MPDNKPTSSRKVQTDQPLSGEKQPGPDSIAARLDAVRGNLVSGRPPNPITEKELVFAIRDGLASERFFDGAFDLLADLDDDFARSLWDGLGDKQRSHLHREIERIATKFPRGLRISQAVAAIKIDHDLADRLFATTLRAWSPPKGSDRRDPSGVLPVIWKCLFSRKDWPDFITNKDDALTVVGKLATAFELAPTDDRRRVEPELLRSLGSWIERQLERAEVQDTEREPILERFYTAALGTGRLDNAEPAQPGASARPEVKEKTSAVPAGPQETVPSADVLTVEVETEPAESGSPGESPGLAREPSSQPADTPRPIAPPEPKAPKAPKSPRGSAKSGPLNVPSPVHEPTLLAETARKAAFAIRAEIEKRRTEVQLIEKLADELDSARSSEAVALKEAETTHQRLTTALKDLKNRTEERDRAVLKIESQQENMRLLESQREALVVELKAAETLLDELRDQHSHQLDNQIPLRLEELRSQISGKLKPIFVNKRLTDKDEPTAATTEFLRVMFIQVEEALTKLGIKL